MRHQHVEPLSKSDGRVFSFVVVLFCAFASAGSSLGGLEARRKSVGHQSASAYFRRTSPGKTRSIDQVVEGFFFTRKRHRK